MAQRTLADRLRLRLRRQFANPFEHRVRAPLRRLRNARRDYRPLFVGGASGSGTSVLSVALGQHFDVAGVVYESNSQVSRESFLFVPAVEDFGSVAAYQDHMTPRDSWSPEQGRRDLLDMYRAYSSGRSEFVIDKGPDINLLRAGFLKCCFPDSLFVTIFRDPVANIEGLRRKWTTFNEDTLEAGIRFYAAIHEAFLQAAESFPESAILVPYQEFTADPNGTMEAIGARFGLARSKRPRRLQSRSNVEGKGIRNVRYNRVHVVTDADQRARDRMDPADVKQIEAALDPLFERLRSSAITIHP